MCIFLRCNYFVFPIILEKVIGDCLYMLSSVVIVIEKSRRKKHSFSRVFMIRSKTNCIKYAALQHFQNTRFHCFPQCPHLQLHNVTLRLQQCVVRAAIPLYILVPLSQTVKGEDRNFEIARLRGNEITPGENSRQRDFEDLLTSGRTGPKKTRIS